VGATDQQFLACLSPCDRQQIHFSRAPLDAADSLANCPEQFVDVPHTDEHFGMTDRHDYGTPYTLG
jgi:hypothetical protein